MTTTETLYAHIAEVCHEANRAIQRQLGEIVNFPWENSPQSIRDSAIDGVRNILENGATPEQSHENWLRFKEREGWTYGPVKDFAKKQHPCMVPFAELPADQKVKDALFHGIVHALAGR